MTVDPATYPRPPHFRLRAKIVRFREQPGGTGSSRRSGRIAVPGRWRQRLRSTRARRHSGPPTAEVSGGKRSASRAAHLPDDPPHHRLPRAQHRHLATVVSKPVRQCPATRAGAPSRSDRSCPLPASDLLSRRTVSVGPDWSGRNPAPERLRHRRFGRRHPVHLADQERAATLARRAKRPGRRRSRGAPRREPRPFTAFANVRNCRSPRAIHAASDPSTRTTTAPAIRAGFRPPDGSGHGSAAP